MEPLNSKRRNPFFEFELSPPYTEFGLSAVIAQKWLAGHPQSTDIMRRAFFFIVGKRLYLWSRVGNPRLLRGSGHGAYYVRILRRRLLESQGLRGRSLGRLRHGGRRTLRRQRRIVGPVQQLLRLEYRAVSGDLGEVLGHVLEGAALRLGDVNVHPSEYDEAHDRHHYEESGPGHGVGHGEEGGRHDSRGDAIHEGPGRVVEMKRNLEVRFS
jgi:hypothetical protein